MEQLKAPAALITTAGATAATWLETANAYVDLGAGIIAMVAGVCAIALYIKKYRAMTKKGERSDAFGD